MSTRTVQADPVERILSRLRDAGMDPREANGGFTARCPAHEDSTPSLSIRSGDDGRALVKCHAGCAPAEVVGAIGLRLSDLFAGPAAPTGRGVMGGAQHRVGRARRAADPKWAEIAARLAASIPAERLRALAELLGVDEAALALLGVGYASQDELERIIGKRPRAAAWIFPMRGGTGEIVGLNGRSELGHKWTLSGGQNGLFAPKDLDRRPDPVLIPEGASDTAAALTLGYTAVGRPSATGGVAQLAELLRGRRVFIIGENDAKPDGTWPGRDGAYAVARGLGRKWGGSDPAVLMPPDGVKDLRDWLREQRRARPA